MGPSALGKLRALHNRLLNRMMLLPGPPSGMIFDMDSTVLANRATRPHPEEGGRSKVMRPVQGDWLRSTRARPCLTHFVERRVCMSWLSVAVEISFPDQ